MAQLSYPNTLTNGQDADATEVMANFNAAKTRINAVTTEQIVDANVTAAKLATDAVETAKIKDLNVTAGKLAADAVETAKVKDDAVQKRHYKLDNGTDDVTDNNWADATGTEITDIVCSAGDKLLVMFSVACISAGTDKEILIKVQIDQTGSYADMGSSYTMQIPGATGKVSSGTFIWLNDNLTGTSPTKVKMQFKSGDATNVTLYYKTLYVQVDKGK